MTVERNEPTAEGFARAIAASLKPGKYGTPKIIERFGSTDGDRAGFVVQSAEPDALDTKTYRVTVEVDE